MMRLPIVAILLILAAAVAACVNDADKQHAETPRIVEVFACSDYCPGPREQYIKRVYEGVTDEETCRRLGGQLYTIVGWGKRTVCEVQ